MQENYQNTELVFLDIANIHVMRERCMFVLTVPGRRYRLMVSELSVLGQDTLGACHYAQNSGNVGWKSKGKVHFGLVRLENLRPPLELEVVYFDRSDWLD